MNALIDAGANINALSAPGWSGRTALMFAADGNHAKIVVHLLAHGASVYVDDQCRGSLSRILNSVFKEYVIPDRINDAIVSLALAARGCKKKAKE